MAFVTMLDLRDADELSAGQAHKLYGLTATMLEPLRSRLAPGNRRVYQHAAIRAFIPTLPGRTRDKMERTLFRQSLTRHQAADERREAEAATQKWGKPVQVKRGTSSWRLPAELWTTILQALTDQTDPLRGVTEAARDVANLARTCKELWHVAQQGLQMLNSAVLAEPAYRAAPLMQPFQDLARAPQSMTLTQLKAAGRAADVVLKGSKAELIHRLLGFLRLTQGPTSCPVPLLLAVAQDCSSHPPLCELLRRYDSMMRTTFTLERAPDLPATFPGPQLRCVLRVLTVSKLEQRYAAAVDKAVQTTEAVLKTLVVPTDQNIGVFVSEAVGAAINIEPVSIMMALLTKRHISAVEAVEIVLRPE